MPARPMRSLPLGLLALLALGACTHVPRGGGEEVEEGLASYYAASLEGRPTASGAPYRGERMSCAHRRWAFGTRIRVTNLENGRSAVVTVNDRGPFVRGRVIDLSLAAARALGMVERGVVRVRIQRLSP